MPPAPVEEVFEEIPCTAGKSYQITKKIVDELQPLYPAVDLRAQFRKMHGWALANAKLRKTHGGMPRFIHSWLAKEQDRAGTGAPRGNVRDSARLSADEKYAATQLGRKA